MGGVVRLTPQNATLPRPRLLAPRLPAAQTSSGKELKSCDFPLQAATPQVNILGLTATFICVNTVQEGSSFYNRIGRRIQMQSLHVTGDIIDNGTAGGAVGHYLRIMMLYDRQPNGAAPVIGDVLTDYGSQGVTSSTSYSHLNMNNADRFKILRDLRIHIADDSTNTVDNVDQAIIDYTNNRVNVNEFIRLGALDVHYKASSNPGVIGDIASGALWVVTFGNVASASSPYSFKWTARLRYNDS